MTIFPFTEQFFMAIELMQPANDFIRITYASRATFNPFSSQTSHEIQQILQAARRHNPQVGVVGALYYGNRCFFQCLEGRQRDVERLLAKLMNDPRHQDVKVIDQTSIERPIFQQWEMKFANMDQEMRQFLRKHDLVKFDPYDFDAAMSDELVSMMYQAEVVDQKQYAAELAFADQSIGQTSLPTWQDLQPTASKGLVMTIWSVIIVLGLCFSWLLFNILSY